LELETGASNKGTIAINANFGRYLQISDFAATIKKPQQDILRLGTIGDRAAAIGMYCLVMITAGWTRVARGQEQYQETKQSHPGQVTARMFIC